MTAADENVNYFQVQMPQISVPIYICKRNGDRHLVRMLMIYPTAGEVWYLRILLFNRPFFDDVIFDAMTDDYNDNPTLIKQP
ncbi:hypothetical protein B484DRAFT_403330 [Ochromonadaceae sp. CCMP2298]|nr:hypothetical protein B484DRAFT_403330 [Ochromonadaceae sp. CCMP2298]